MKKSRNEYKRDWKRAKKNRRCIFCNESFIPNGISKECSLKCKLLNRHKVINGCWEWQGKIGKNGYGYIQHKKEMLVHRASYETFIGEIDKRKNVCHKCDNKKCMNPDHLWMGSQKENIQDAKEKKRLSKQPMKKLNLKQVKEIKEGLRKGKTQISLAHDNGVSNTVIHYIKIGKHYKEE